MKLITAFNQMDYFKGMMDIEGWESALQDGSCSALSVAFMSFLNKDLSKGLNFFFEEINKNRASVAEFQTTAIQEHQRGLDGYSYLLNEFDLVWETGTQYSNKNFLDNFKNDSAALCVFQSGPNAAHTISIFYSSDPSLNMIYIFDPNVGLIESGADSWYNTEFETFLNAYYPNKIGDVWFKNVMGKS